MSVVELETHTAQTLCKAHNGSGIRCCPVQAGIFLVVTYDILQSHPDMDHDLNYSGSIPTATTLIPDPYWVEASLKFQTP